MFDRVCLSKVNLFIFYGFIATILFILRRDIVALLIWLGSRFRYLGNFLSKNNRFVVSFFLFTLFISVVEICLESSFVYVPKVLFSLQQTTLLILAISIPVLLLILFLSLRPSEYNKALKIQKINNQYSWIAYFHFAVSLAPIISIILFYLFSDFWQEKMGFKMFGGLNLTSIIIRIILLFIGMAWYWIIKPLEQKDQFKGWRFAPYSINTESDRFGWKEAAAREARNILLMDKYVSVVVVDGNQGDGKSSYSRMIVDALTEKDKSKILYTYISLTETNQEKDFSKMFLERCFATISERYPKINFSNSLPIIREGLRDNGYGIWSAILDMLTRLNSGISKTISMVHDPYTQSNGYVDKEVAEKFGNVQVVNEDLWLILIDEIDRAPAKEIYRAIETIERYKHDGRCGLPVKIVFMLCVDRLTLYKNLRGIKYA